MFYVRCLLAEVGRRLGPTALTASWMAEADLHIAQTATRWLDRPREARTRYW
jgi:hypothetical protein